MEQTIAFYHSSEFNVFLKKKIRISYFSIQFKTTPMTTLYFSKGTQTCDYKNVTVIPWQIDPLSRLPNFYSLSSIEIHP